MKPKIKLRLVKFEKAIAVQILEQDERFRSTSMQLALAYQCKNGFVINSGCGPWLEASSFYLRGDNGKLDMSISHRFFASNADRDLYISRLTEALRDWAANAPQFKEDKAEAVTAGDDTILEF